jgi:hypothetical protein
MQMGLLARTPAGRDMAVSSGSDDDEDAGARSPRKGGSSKKKQQKKGKHMTEEEMEAVQGAKGAKKAREWLESGFGGYKAVSTSQGAAKGLPFYRSPAWYEAASCVWAIDC